MTLTAGALLLPLSTSQGMDPLAVGEVAPQDVLAPYALSYQSEVLTEQQRLEAEKAVAPAYAPPNAAIARAQVSQLRSVLIYINSVREDNLASEEQKAADLSAIQYIQLTPEKITQALTLAETGWAAVQQEAIIVLEQVMRSTIREDRLEEARRSVPAR